MVSSYTMSNSTVLQLCNRSHLHTPVCRGQVPIGRATWPHRHELSDCTRRGAHSLVAPSARQRSEPRQPRRRGTRRRSLQGSNCRLQDCRLASELPMKNIGDPSRFSGICMRLESLGISDIPASTVNRALAELHGQTTFEIESPFPRLANELDFMISSRPLSVTMRAACKRATEWRDCRIADFNDDASASVFCKCASWVSIS